MKKTFAAIFCLISVTSAFAESGQFEVLSGGSVSVVSNDFGSSNFSITNVRYTNRVISSNLSFFGVGTINTSQCLGTLSSENSKTTGGGTCLGTDTDGDKWRLNYTRTDSTGQTVFGVAELIGLTGKFANAKGTCNYEQKRLVLDGIINVSTLLKCSVTK